ncbi:MAG: MFS transporter [Bacteroidales bacterium]
MKKILPVLFAFFVMGFCDVVGIATSYVKLDFGWSETMAGFVPSMVFVWFFFLSVPAALAMNKTGRKTMVILSNVITFIGMLIPFVSYNVYTCMTAFIFLGIGNTILQVSLNPLLSNVVSGKNLTSSLTTGQVIKAVSSFCGPIIAAFAATQLGNWKYLFPIFAVITLISTLWLLGTKMDKETDIAPSSSFGSALGLLKTPFILMLFMGIFCIVGVDVGTNTVGPKLLIERCGLAVTSAGIASSTYFICRTAGALIGAILLAKINERKYFIVNIFAAIASLIALLFARNEISILVGVGCVGFFCSSIYAIIYSIAMKRYPGERNELSGLLTMGVCGGAVIPPLMGVLTDSIGNQTGSLIIIGICMAFVLFCGFNLKLKTTTND